MVTIPEVKTKTTHSTSYWLDITEYHNHDEALIAFQKLCLRELVKNITNKPLEEWSKNGRELDYLLTHFPSIAEGAVEILNLDPWEARA